MTLAKLFIEYLVFQRFGFYRLGLGLLLQRCNSQISIRMKSFSNATYLNYNSLHLVPF